jgi:VanZ family protein
MRNEKLKKLKIAISWFAVFVCMSFIFYESNQSAAISENISKGIVKGGIDAAIGITKEKISEIDLSNLIVNVNNIARGYMHWIIFLILGLLLLNALMQTRKSFKNKLTVILISFSICLIYAISDETHQLFVPGRTFQLTDLLMDSSGSIVGIGVFWLINYFKARGKHGSLKTAR